MKYSRSNKANAANPHLIYGIMQTMPAKIPEPFTPRRIKRIWRGTLLGILVGIVSGLGGIVFNHMISIGTRLLSGDMVVHLIPSLRDASILGFPVSGRPLYMVSVLDTQQAGPDLWTGGAFGPEAGLLSLFAGLIGLALILWWVRWRQGVISLERLAANMGPKEKKS